jgi:hypothetical protein
VTAVIHAGLSPRTPDEIGRMLWRENLASVAYRYPYDKDGERPGPVGFRDSDVDTYTWAEAPLLDGGALNKTISCYDYQSCEHPGYKDSEAKQVIDRLRNPVIDTEFPDDVPWGWD